MNILENPSLLKEQKTKFLEFKLDIARAYDRMEWDLISHARNALGFHVEFIGIIKECLMSLIPS